MPDSSAVFGFPEKVCGTLIVHQGAVYKYRDIIFIHIHMMHLSFLDPGG